MVSTVKVQSIKNSVVRAAVFFSFFNKILYSSFFSPQRIRGVWDGGEEGG